MGDRIAVITFAILAGVASLGCLVAGLSFTPSPAPVLAILGGLLLIACYYAKRGERLLSQIPLHVDSWAGLPIFGVPLTFLANLLHFPLQDALFARMDHALGFDWLTVDTEHNPIDIRTTSQMFGAIAHSGVAPLVRIPWNEPENFKRVLDAGAWGIVVPMVNSREEAERAVEATFFPPKGKRSVGGGMTGLRFGTSGAEYLRHADDEILLVLQIEHVDAVERCDDPRVREQLLELAHVRLVRRDRRAVRRLRSDRGVDLLL